MNFRKNTYIANGLKIMLFTHRKQFARYKKDKTLLPKFFKLFSAVWKKSATKKKCFLFVRVFCFLFPFFFFFFPFLSCCCSLCRNFVTFLLWHIVFCFLRPSISFSKQQQNSSQIRLNPQNKGHLWVQ